jgi:hypothetical protein
MRSASALPRLLICKATGVSLQTGLQLLTKASQESDDNNLLMCRVMRTLLMDHLVHHKATGISLLIINNTSNSPAQFAPPP